MADFEISVGINAKKTKDGAKEAKSAIKEVRDETDKLGKSSKSAADRDIAGLAANMKKVAAVATGMGTAFTAVAAVLATVASAALAVGKVLYEIAQSYAKFATEVRKAEQITGLSAKTLSGLRHAAEMTGVSFDTLGDGITEFMKTIAEANRGNKEASAKMNRLGLDAKKAGADLDGAFKAGLKRIISLPPGIDRTTAAMDMFGDSVGKKIVPLIESFNGDIEELIKQAQKFGVVLSNEDVRAAEEFDKSLKGLWETLRGVGVAIGKEVIGPFQQMATEISAWLQRNPGEVQWWAQAFADSLRFVRDAVTLLKNDLEALADWWDGVKNDGLWTDPARLERGRQRDVVRQQVINRRNGTDFFKEGPWAQDDELSMLRSQPWRWTDPAPYNRPGDSRAKKTAKEIFKLSSQGQAIVDAAKKLGISPLDLATIISFETAGTFSPSVTNRQGYRGLIQFGPQEQRDFGVSKGQGFENQVLTSVVNYFKTRFASAGRSTEGASLLDLYTTVIAGNPNASRTARDANGVSAISGVRKMGPHRQRALGRFFGGSLSNVPIDNAQMTAEAQELQAVLELEARLASLRENGINDMQLMFDIAKSGREEEIRNLETILRLQNELGDRGEIGDPVDALARLTAWKRDNQAVDDIIRDLNNNAGRLGITSGIVNPAKAANPQDAREMAQQWSTISQTLEDFASQSAEVTAGIEAMKIAGLESLDPLQQLDLQWKMLKESGQLTDGQLQLLAESFEKLRPKVEQFTNEQRKLNAEKMGKDLLADLNEEIQKLSVELGISTELTYADRTAKLLLTDAYKDLTQATKDDAIAKAKQADQLRESLKAQEDAKRAYDDVYQTIRGHLQVLSEEGFGGFFKSIYRQFKQFLTDMVAQWLTSKFFQLFFKGGNQQQAAANGQGNGGIFGGIFNAIFGSGSGMGPGGTPMFNFAGTGGQGNSGGLAALASLGAGVHGGNPNMSAGGGGIFGRGGLFGEQGFGNNVGTYSAIGGIATIVGGAVGGRVGGFISGAGSGLAMGAQIGTMFMPGIGTAIGAAVGAIAGGLMSLFGGDPKRKRDKREKLPALQQGFTDALRDLRQLLQDVRTLRVDPDTALTRADELRSQIATGFGIQFESKKYRKQAQSLIRTRLTEADALIAEIRTAAEVARAAGERERRIIPEFAGGVFMSSSFARQLMDFKRRNGMLPGRFTGLDTMPAMLAPGEMVLNPAQQARVRSNAGSDPFVGAGIPGYAGGIAMQSAASAPIEIHLTPEISIDAEGMVRTNIKFSSNVQREIKVVMNDAFANDEVKTKRRGS